MTVRAGSIDLNSLSRAGRKLCSVVCALECSDLISAKYPAISTHVPPQFKTLKHPHACAKIFLNQLRNVIIAYEPVWAIGTGLAATASQVQEVHAYLRSIVTNFHVELAKNIKIIYGGSLKPSNADEILKLADVDGGLIGGASLCGKDFGEIVKHAKAFKNAKHVK